MGFAKLRFACERTPTEAARARGMARQGRRHCSNTKAFVSQGFATAAQRLASCASGGARGSEQAPAAYVPACPRATRAPASAVVSCSRGSDVSPATTRPPGCLPKQRARCQRLLAASGRSRTRTRSRAALDRTRRRVPRRPAQPQQACGAPFGRSAARACVPGAPRMPAARRGWSAGLGSAVFVYVLPVAVGGRALALRLLLSCCRFAAKCLVAGYTPGCYTPARF